MIVLVMGVSGAGKTTFASALAVRLACRFLEADDLHPAANVAKMRAGQALSDADRRPWLDAIARRLREFARSGTDVVVACSALKAAYRQALKPANAAWLLIYLDARPDELVHRLAARTGHFMPATLLRSQLASLEKPAADERPLVLDAQASAERNLAEALDAIQALQATDPAPDHDG